MAKKDVSAGVQENRELLSRGEGPKAGWCYDGDRDPEFFECEGLDEAVAKGDVSVSFDRATVTDLATGEVRQEKDTVRAKATLVNPGNAGATNADTATTGNAGGGGGGGGGAARATAGGSTRAGS